MNMKTLLLVGFLAALSGCSTYSAVSTEKDAWIMKETSGEDQLYYCRGNPQASGPEAAPLCFFPTYVGKPESKKSIPWWKQGDPAPAPSPSASPKS